MVAEGELTRPTVALDSLILAPEDDKIAWKVKLKIIEDEVTQLSCNGGGVCKLDLRDTLEFHNVFRDGDDFRKLCYEIFDPVNKARPDDGGGGVADTEASTSRGSDT
ncbi:hypothetical protein F4778DRAFT_778720 [Xylariomycetidae sp. FL2044]|nr:hypothetical protein F4778DRAFT_778720 [Xylariomycetidae sp. FL2044]